MICSRDIGFQTKSYGVIEEQNLLVCKKQIASLTNAIPNMSNICVLAQCHRRNCDKSLSKLMAGIPQFLEYIIFVASSTQEYEFWCHCWDVNFIIF